MSDEVQVIEHTCARCGLKGSIKVNFDATDKNGETRELEVWLCGADYNLVRQNLTLHADGVTGEESYNNTAGTYGNPIPMIPRANRRRSSR